jgi:transposase-like protein
MATEPTTLQEAIVYFRNLDNCLSYLSIRRWPDGVVVCPMCGSTQVRFLSTRRLWECKTKHARQQFSIKVGTILEDSPLGLDKWLPAMWMIGNDRNGISSWELHRALGVTQKTAWFMLHRIRLSMQDRVSGGKLAGEVEVDGTFIGGKAPNMHKDVRARKITGTGGKDKAMVLGILERGGMVRTKVVPNRKRHALRSEVRKHVEAGSNVYSDALKS